jgi:hypothetical protein
VRIFSLGANLNTDNSSTLALSLDRLFVLLPHEKQQEFLSRITVGTP